MIFFLKNVHLETKTLKIKYCLFNVYLKIKNYLFNVQLIFLQDCTRFIETIYVYLYTKFIFFRTFRI
jgi:hypothetical protein